MSEEEKKKARERRKEECMLTNTYGFQIIEFALLRCSSNTLFVEKRRQESAPSRHTHKHRKKGVEHQQKLPQSNLNTHYLNLPNSQSHCQM